MNCIFTGKYIHDYLDGELDELTALIIREHLTECEACKTNAAQIKQLFYEIDKLGKETVEVPEELDSICDRVYNICNGKKRFTIKDYICIQKVLLKRQVSFISFIPGTRKLGKTAVKLGKTTAVTLGKGAAKTLGFLVRQGYKVTFSRG